MLYAVGKLRRRASVVLVALLLAASGGCANWNWRGTGLEGKDDNWAQPYRPAADQRGFSGLDQRARDIERNLGVR